MAVNPPKGFSILEAFGEVGDALEKGDKARLDAQRQEIQNRLDETRIRQTNVEVQTQQQQLSEMMQSAPLRERINAAAGAEAISVATESSEQHDRMAALRRKMDEELSQLPVGDPRRTELENLLKSESGVLSAKKEAAEAESLTVAATTARISLGLMQDFAEQIKRVKGQELDLAEAQGNLKTFVAQQAEIFFKAHLAGQNPEARGKFLAAVAGGITGSTQFQADDIAMQASRVQLELDQAMQVDNLAMAKAEAVVKQQGLRLSAQAFIEIWGNDDAAVRQKLVALREDNPELFSLVHSNFVKKVGGVFEAGAAAADIVTSMTKLTMPVPGVSGSLGRGRSSRFVDPTTMDDVFQLEPDQSVSTSGTSLMGTDEGVITMGAVFAHLPDMMRNAYSLQEAHAVNGQVQPGMDSITIENKVRTLIEQSEVFIGPTRRRARAVQTATDPETGAVTGNSVILPYSVATTLGIPTEGIPATTIRLKDGGEVESLEHVQVPLNDFIQRMTMVQRAGYQREKALSPTGSGSADPLGDHRRAVAAYLEPLVSSATNLGQTVPGLSEAVAALNIPPPQEHKTRLTTAAPTAPEKRFAPEVMGQASFWQADPGSITSSILEAMQRSQFYSSVVGFMAQDSREKATAIGEATREGDLGGIVNVADVPHVIVGIEGTDYVLRNLSGKTKRTVNFPMTSAGEPTDWVDRNELAEMILPKGFSNAETATRFLRTHFEGLLQAGQHLPRATAPDRQLEAVEVAELSNALWRADSNSDNLVDTAGGNYIRMVQGLGQMAGGSDEEDAVTYILDFLTAPGMTPQERIGMAMYLSPQRAVEYTRWRRDREVRRLDGAEAEPPPVWASAVASGKRIAIRHTLGLEHLVGGQSEFSDGLLEGHLIGSSFLPSPLQLLGEKLPAYLGKSAEAAMGARAFNEEAAQSGDTISQVSMTGAQRTADEARDVRVQFPEYGTIGYPDSGKVWMVDTERSVFGGRYGTPFTATPARSISELLRKMTSTPAPVPGVMEALFQITQDDPLGDGLVNNRWGPALVAPSAAKELGFQAGGRNPRSLPAWRTDPVLNADVGYSFMSHLTAKYVTGDLATLIYAYLWGPGHVDHAQAMHGEAWKSQAPRDVRKVGELWIQRVIGTPDLPMVVGETR